MRTDSVDSGRPERLEISASPRFRTIGSGALKYWVLMICDESSAQELAEEKGADHDREGGQMPSQA
jgi:hypothetical protein